MDHVAIMKPSWKLINKILTGKKTIESRWYLTRRAPWNRIRPGDTVYFKDAAQPVTAKATVSKVLQYADYSDDELRAILDKHGSQICFVNSKKDVLTWAQTKRYCVLIFLTNAQKVSPFAINKTGFGNACAWMCVEDIEKIKRSPEWH